MATIEERLEDLMDEFQDFRDTYETDMRGDKKLNGGNRGVIGNIREIKETLHKYPSLLYMLAHNPVRTVITLVIVYVILTVLYTFGLLRVFAQMFGVTLP